MLVDPTMSRNRTVASRRCAPPCGMRRVLRPTSRLGKVLVWHPGAVSGQALARSFYARPSLVVARALLGRDLVRMLPSGECLVARIVEAEAYREDDPASHSYKGRT